MEHLAKKELEELDKESRAYSEAIEKASENLINKYDKLNETWQALIEDEQMNIKQIENPWRLQRNDEKKSRFKRDISAEFYHYLGLASYQDMRKIALYEKEQAKIKNKTIDLILDEWKEMNHVKK